MNADAIAETLAAKALALKILGHAQMESEPDLLACLADLPNVQRVSSQKGQIPYVQSRI